MKLLPLTRGLSAVVDDGVYEWASKFKWYAQSHPGYEYAVRNDYSGSKPKTILLHRIIAGAQPDDDVDHINGDPLDNRTENLRCCSHKDNMRNHRRKARKYLPGVLKWKSKKGIKWAARGGSGEGRVYLGQFDTEEAAHAAHLAYNKKEYKEFYNK